MTGLLCGQCERVLPVSGFAPINRSPQKSFNHITLGRCRDCRKEYNNAYGKTPEARAAAKASRDRRKERLRYRQFWAKYKITREQWERMFADQGHKCALCYRSEPTKRGWMVDHNHNTGRVRGILCGNCNAAIGLFRENTSSVMNCYHYLLEDYSFGQKPSVVVRHGYTDEDWEDIGFGEIESDEF